MAVTAMAVMVLAATEATAMERGPPMLMLRLSLLPRPSLRLMPTMALTALAPMAVMAAMAPTDTARGPLMPMPTMALTALAAMVATDTAGGLLMPMPTMAATAMAAMMATDTARGPLMPMPTMVLATAMAVTAAAMAVTATASKPQTSKSAIASLHQNCHLKISSITRRPGKLMAVCLSTINQTTNEEFRYIHTAL